MATAIQRRRGNTAQHASFTGLAGEITIDTEKNTVVVHDGTTAGGYPLAKSSEVAALGGADITAVVAGDGLTGGATSGNATINIGAGAGITVNADNVAINAAYFDVTAGGTGWTGNLEPSANNTYSLGSPTRVWNDVYVGPNSLVIDGVALGITSGVLTFGGANVAVAGSASSNADTRALFSATDAGGDGSFSYSSSTGVFTYTGPSQAEANTRIDARLSGGTGITYTSGVIAVDSTIATKDYANTAATNAVAAVIDSAPAALDTLNELAAALGDDANFSTTITTSISNKLATADFSSTANTWISTQSTTALAEGTNLYFTAARARGNISVTDAGGDGSLSYDNSTGVITYTGPSQAEANTRIDARLSGGTGITYTSGVIATTITQYTDALAKAAISVTDAGGDGSLSYNSSTGVITYTGPSATEVRAHFTAGTGVAISSGQISIGQEVGTTSSVSFNNVTATGNFFGNVTGNVTGNAGTATTLATARTIGGVSFNGSAAIDLPGVNTAGNQNTTGNAGTATKWATARTITLTGDVTGVSGNFDGSDNLSFATTIAANSVAPGTDTTGNYVASVANGAYITGGAAGSEGATLTLAVDATTTATASKVAARDASGDLYAAIFQGTASSARYADLAERYEADAILEPGTVVCFGGEKEITACDHENDHAVAGVVSTDPAYMMNSAAGNNDTHPYIALTGRVPVKVVGPVAKGDLLVASSVKGHAMANNNAKAGTIIGKAISSSDNGESVVEALINLM